MLLLVISSPEPKAHRTRRCCRCRCCGQPFSKIFSSGLANQSQILCGVSLHPWEGGTKVSVIGPGLITKMATTLIYGKNL